MPICAAVSYAPRPFAAGNGSANRHFGLGRQGAVLSRQSGPPQIESAAQDQRAQLAWPRDQGRGVMNSPVVLITGALTGIGRAAAVIFAQEGARVVVSGRREKEGKELVAELKALGAEAIFVRTDVRKDEDVRNVVDETVKRFGRLDIAVNNAGTEGTPGPVTDQTAESYADTFDTNVLGVLLSMKHELRAMLP